MYLGPVFGGVIRNFFSPLKGTDSLPSHPVISFFFFFFALKAKLYRKPLLWPLKGTKSIPVLFIWEFQTHPSFVNETVSNNGCIATYQVLKKICPNNLLPLTPTNYIYSLQEMSCSPVPMILDACIEITIMKKRSVCCCLLNCNFDMLRGFQQ